jgi:hypothetical protein
VTFLPPQQSEASETGSKRLPSSPKASWKVLNKLLRIGENGGVSSCVTVGQLTNSQLRRPKRSFLILSLNLSNEFLVQEQSLPSSKPSKLFVSHAYSLIL